MKKKDIVSSALAAGLAVVTPTISQAAGIHCEGIATKWVNDCGANGHECASQATSNFDPKEWLKMSKADCAAVQKALKNPAVKKYVERVQQGTVVAVKRGKKF